MRTILCFGDSNTYGYCAADGRRYGPDVRWAGRLRGLLGAGYQVLEEAQSGRTTVWEDPIEQQKCGRTYLRPCLESHSPIDMVVLLLGINDTKKRFSLTAHDVAAGAEVLVRDIGAFTNIDQPAPPKVLLIAPPPLTEGIYTSAMGGLFTKESRAASLELAHWYRQVAQNNGCLYLDGADVLQADPLDGLHFTAEGHAALAVAVARIITGHYGG